MRVIPHQKQYIFEIQLAGKEFLTKNKYFEVPLKTKNVSPFVNTDIASRIFCKCREEHLSEKLCGPF